MNLFKKLKQTLFGSAKPAKAKPSKAKKVAVKKSKAKKVKKPAKSKVVRKSTKKAAAPAKEKIQGQLIGSVTHYFPQVNAAVVKIDKLTLAVGDSIYIKGHTTNFKQVLSSLQIDRKPIEKAGKGAEIGIEVKDRVRIGDEVYKLNK